MLRWLKRRREARRELLFWKSQDKELGSPRAWATITDWEGQLRARFGGLVWVQDITVAYTGFEYHLSVTVWISQWSRLWLGFYEERLKRDVEHAVQQHRPATITAEVEVKR